MPKKGLSMRQIRELLRLRTCEPALSARSLALHLGVARSTVQDCLNRLSAADLYWPLPAELTDDVLERRLFGRAGTKTGLRRLPEADWPSLIGEMKRPGVNLQVLWEEYRQVHADGYGYSGFCELYREFELRLSPTMRQSHVAGEKLFVDYSGKKIGIVDPMTGEVVEAEIFVAVLGASNYTYAEATWTQSLSTVRLLPRRCLQLSSPMHLLLRQNPRAFSRHRQCGSNCPSANPPGQSTSKWCVYLVTSP